MLVLRACRDLISIPFLDWKYVKLAVSEQMLDYYNNNNSYSQYIISKTFQILFRYGTIAWWWMSLCYVGHWPNNSLNVSSASQSARPVWYTQRLRQCRKTLLKFDHVSVNDEQEIQCDRWDGVNGRKIPCSGEEVYREISAYHAGRLRTVMFLHWGISLSLWGGRV